MSIDRLVVENLPYARALARRLGKRGHELEDLEQEAALALVEAAKKFDPTENPGVPFVAFARPILVRRLGAMACPEAMSSLPTDLPSPRDPHQQQTADELWSAMDVLTDREQQLLIRRYGLDGRGPTEITDLCDEFKLSARWVTDLLGGAREKLKSELTSRGWRNRSRAAETQPMRAHG